MFTALTGEYYSRFVDVPVAVEAAVAPVQPVLAPRQKPNIQETVRAAVDGPPEVDVASSALLVLFPALGNELGILEQVVEDVGVQYTLALKFLVKLFAFDGHTLCLVRRQEEINLLAVEEEAAVRKCRHYITRLLMRLHFPTIGNERVGTHVDNGVFYDHFNVISEEAFDTLHAAKLVEDRLHRS